MPAETPEARAERELQVEIEQYADQIANDLGPAAGADRVSDKEKLEMWGRSDPRVASDPEAFKQMLMQGGIPQEALDQHNKSALGIVRAIPEIAEILAQPMDEQMADMVTRLAEYPLRLAVLADLVDDPEGMVKESDRLSAQWQKQHGAAALPPVEASESVRNPQQAYAGAKPPQNLLETSPKPPTPDVGAPVAVPPQLPNADLAQMLGG